MELKPGHHRNHILKTVELPKPSKNYAEKTGPCWSGTAWREIASIALSRYSFWGWFVTRVAVTLASTAGAWFLLLSVSLFAERFILLLPGQSPSWPWLDETLAMADHTRHAYKMTLRVLFTSAGTAPEKIHTETDGLKLQRSIVELSAGCLPSGTSYSS